MLKIIIIIIRGCCFLWGAFLEGALLEGAFLEGALLERCVFRGCSFRGVRFQRGAQKQESPIIAQPRIQFLNQVSQTFLAKLLPALFWQHIDLQFNLRSLDSLHGQSRLIVVFNLQHYSPYNYLLVYCETESKIQYVQGSSILFFYRMVGADWQARFSDLAHILS